MKRRKRVVSVLLSGLMVVSMCSGSLTVKAEATGDIAGGQVSVITDVAAEETCDIAYGTGFQAPEIEVHEYTESEWNAIPHTETVVDYKATSDPYWDSFSSDYFYAQLTNDEKIVYDSLYQSCYYYLLNNDDISEGFKINYENCDLLRMKEIVQIFMYENPQFYYLSNRSGYSYYPSRPTSGTLMLYVYDEYQSGSARANETEALKTAINSYLEQVSQKTTLIEKERVIHDLLVKNITYGSSIHDQSCISAFIDRTTVCAGYAEAFALLANAVGIETIAVTSDNHEWNKVYMNGFWYNVDVTWDDPLMNGTSNYPDGSNLRTTYLNISDSTLLEQDSGGSHVILAWWNSIWKLPKAVCDYGDEAGYTEELFECSLENAVFSAVENQEWTGSAILPSVKVVYAGKTLTEGTDYKVTAANNVNAGTATLTFTGVGDYSGVKNITFEIVQIEKEHIWNAGAVTLQPTCTAAGIKTYTCQTCGRTKTETIAATGHNYVDGICTVCGAKDSDYVIPAPEEKKNGWYTENGNMYWYEDNIRQGYDPANPSYRGKEIYDQDSDAWYWLDAVQGGAKAVSKDVYQESSGGKWVRYDENGHMVKGWQRTDKGTYYFDIVTGAMTKGAVVMDGNSYYFDENNGTQFMSGWIHINDGAVDYWYENGIRQGVKYVNGTEIDVTYRGKEIYDPASDAWYWLDSIDDGKKAVSKDVYQDSWAGDYADREDGTGKWVRYNADGHMVKGWNKKDGNTYYFDPATGAMVKGTVVIDGKTYVFDRRTGVLQ